MAPHFLDIRKQLIFYGAYHNNAANILIHVVFVPLIVWTVGTLQACAPMPAWAAPYVPEFSYRLNDYLLLRPNWALAYGLATWAYYFVLEPCAAILNIPPYLGLIMLSTSFAEKNANAATVAWGVQAAGLVAQFLGHGVAERRAPAFLDSFLSAFVMAPFFVHLEILFALGYRPALRKDIAAGVQVELAKIKAAEAAKGKKAL